MVEYDKMIIRIAEEKDIPSISNLFLQGTKYHANLLPEIFKECTEYPDRVSILSWIKDENSDYIVVEVNGEIVGFLSVKRISSQNLPIFQNTESVLIDSCVIDLKHRRKGLGKALFNKAKEWTKEKGIQRVQLMVWSKNVPAINLYKSLGFEDLIVKMEISI